MHASRAERTIRSGVVICVCHCRAQCSSCTRFHTVQSYSRCLLFPRRHTQYDRPYVVGGSVVQYGHRDVMHSLQDMRKNNKNIDTAKFHAAGPSASCPHTLCKVCITFDCAVVQCTSGSTMFPMAAMSARRMRSGTTRMGNRRHRSQPFHRTRAADSDSRDVCLPDRPGYQLHPLLHRVAAALGLAAGAALINLG